jgi:hypothetical protein
VNEGLVRIGNRSVEIGRLRSAISLAAGLALGAGLAIGVVSAGPSGTAGALTNLPTRLDKSGRFLAGRVTEAADNTVTIALPTAAAATAVASTGPGGGSPAPPSETPTIQTRVIRVLPQTRGPAQRLRPGDFILAIGQPESDGSLTARAVALRRPGQAPRR